MPPIPACQCAGQSRYDVEDAAEYIGLSVSFLNKARVTGKGPVYLKLGSKVIYEIADLDTWLNSHRRTSTSQI